jgi:hypothetical protein
MRGQKMSNPNVWTVIRRSGHPDHLSDWKSAEDVLKYYSKQYSQAGSIYDPPEKLLHNGSIIVPDDLYGMVVEYHNQSRVAYQVAADTTHKAVIDMIPYEKTRMEGKKS